jgi:hypothetical protein
MQDHIRKWLVIVAPEHRLVSIYDHHDGPIEYVVSTRSVAGFYCGSFQGGSCQLSCLIRRSLYWMAEMAVSNTELPKWMSQRKRHVVYRGLTDEASGLADLASEIIRRDDALNRPTGGRWRF